MFVTFVTVISEETCVPPLQTSLSLVYQGHNNATVVHCFTDIGAIHASSILVQQFNMSSRGSRILLYIL